MKVLHACWFYFIIASQEHLFHLISDFLLAVQLTGSSTDDINQLQLLLQNEVCQL